MSESLITLDIQNFNTIMNNITNEQLKAQVECSHIPNRINIDRVRALEYIRRTVDETYPMFGDPRTVTDEIFTSWLFLKTYKTILYVSNSADDKFTSSIQNIIKDECDNIFLQLLEKDLYS